MYSYHLYLFDLVLPSVWLRVRFAALTPGGGLFPQHASVMFGCLLGFGGKTDLMHSLCIFQPELRH